VAGHHFEIRVGERAHSVSVAAARGAEGAVEVVVDGERVTVLKSAGGAMIVRAAGSNQHVCVTLDGQAWPASAQIPGHSAAVAIETAQAAALRAALRSGARNHNGAERVVAPMPGRIVRVAVAVGDQVERGAPLVIVEAMKMENELYASGPGTVTSIAVAQGATVEAGQLLCEIAASAEEPAA